MVGTGFVLTLIYAFALVSLASDIANLIFGVKPYLTWICGPLAMLAAIASGNLLRVWSGPGRYLILFTLWSVFASMLSIFHAGSIETLVEFTTKQLPIFFMLTALMTNLKHVERFFRMMAIAGAIMAVISLKFGGYSGYENRYMLPGTSLENPNDFATHLLLVLPFCIWTIFNRSWIFRIVGVASTGVLGLIILRSGSRAGFLTLLTMIALVLWKTSGSQRAVIVVASVVGAVTAVAIFPQVLWSRFETIFASEPPDNNLGLSTDSTDVQAAAEASSNARWYTFKRSLEFTKDNPIFGVGPGNFAIEEARRAHLEGHRGIWIGTHNSYTQTSSETGIPGFIFFTATLFTCVRIAANIHTRTRNKPEFRPISRTALCLLVSIVSFSVNILFAHLAFRFYVPLLAGMTLAFSMCVERELARRAPAAA